MRFHGFSLRWKRGAVYASSDLLHRRDGDVAPTPSMPGEVMAPVEYSPAWLTVGIALLIAIALFYLLVWWFTRAPRSKPRVTAPAPAGYDPAPYLARIDTIAAQVQAREISERDGYTELSRTVRDAVSEATGIPADTMTLHDLRHTPLRHTSDTVAYFYPGQFGPMPDYDYARALQLAREVLHGWN